MSPISILIPLQTIALLVATSAHVSAETDASRFPKWPLRNGDFSTSQGWGRPTNWEPAVNSGTHDFVMDPPAKFWGRPSAAAVISTRESGDAYYYQKVSVLKGDYSLSVEVAGTGKTRVRIAVGSSRSEFITVDEQWTPVQIDAKLLSGETAVSLLSSSEAGGSAKFRNVKLEVQRLESSAIPFDSGQLGAIVLPLAPTLAESYACYELQRFIHQMTGHAPGLEGRDAIHPGKRIYLGRAAGSSLQQKLSKLREDAYLIDTTGDRVSLAGKTDRGTLYAVYDFLHLQGCRWVMPGELGEVVPQRKSLVSCPTRIESPDYDARGVMVLAQDFFATSGFIMINLDDYYDWFLRNRMNLIWFAETETYDFGAHRGHSWIQRLNHSYNSLIAPHQKHFIDHPEWYPLVDGKRMPVCDIGPKFVNQLCVSNPELRDYTVDLVIEYFNNNPNARAFPLNPMDGPSYWCECEACKRLDGPGLEWPADRSKRPTPGVLTDRALNFANEVARRVSKIHSDRWIEMYAYSYTLQPPVREKVHKNVFIKYANLSGGRGTGPLGKSMLDPEVKIWKDWCKQLDGWKNAGATLAFYNYLEWEHPDVTLFWFYNTVDVLKNLNREYGCRILCGETENNIPVSVMLYNVLARTLWDVDTDYVEVIRDLCHHYYGPAGDLMFQYNMSMDLAIRESEAWKDEGWRPNEHLDLSFAVLKRGQAILDQATVKAGGDPKLLKRIAFARLGHASLTYVRALTEKQKTTKTAKIARRAFDTANAIRSEYGIMIKLPSERLLESFVYPSSVR
jgi:hypothetical protein